MSASTYVVVIVGAELPSTDTEPDTTPSIVNVLAVFHASAVDALPTVSYTHLRAHETLR